MIRLNLKIMAQINKFLRVAENNPIADALLQNHIDTKGESMKGGDTSKGVELEDVEQWPSIKELPVGRREIIDTMRAMDAMDVARYLVGRHSRKTRIEWRVKPEDLVVHEEPVGDELGVALGTLPVESQMPAVSTNSLLLNHTFYLRPELPVTFSLPKDLTDSEADRISTIVKALAFGSKN